MGPGFPDATSNFRGMDESLSILTYFSKPEFVHWCKPILARESAILDCGRLWTELQTRKLELVETVLAGNYDADVALNSLESYY
jgi:hypothetical protein